jgi:hypothetical protein
LFPKIADFLLPFGYRSKRWKNLVCWVEVKNLALPGHNHMQGAGVSPKVVLLLRAGAQPLPRPALRTWPEYITTSRKFSPWMYFALSVLLCAAFLLSSKACKQIVPVKRLDTDGRQRYADWLATFRAADPSYQEYCLSVIRDSRRYQDRGAQYSQDIFLFHNLYRDWPLQGRTGFYVESGANDPLSLSTTLFFDKCLGWKGLCIEPMQQYHQVSTSVFVMASPRTRPIHHAVD